jgi:TonB family protein
MPVEAVAAPAMETGGGDVPVDFTLESAGPAAVSEAKAAPKAPPPAPTPTRTVVPVSELARRPHAPDLDAELERNYPIELRRAGIPGRASLRLQISPEGRVGSIEVVSESHAGFGDACVRTVRQSRWEPPLDVEGRAVATAIIYVCSFEVRH